MRRIAAAALAVMGLMGAAGGTAFAAGFGAPTAPTARDTASTATLVRAFQADPMGGATIDAIQEADARAVVAHIQSDCPHVLPSHSKGRTQLVVAILAVAAFGELGGAEARPIAAAEARLGATASHLHYGDLKTELAVHTFGTLFTAEAAWGREQAPDLCVQAHLALRKGKPTIPAATARYIETLPQLPSGADPLITLLQTVRPDASPGERSRLNADIAFTRRDDDATNRFQKMITRQLAQALI